MRSLLILFMLFQALLVQGQRAMLTGTVTEESGAGVPFVTVYLEGTTLGTTTNLEGAYMFDLPLGFHTVVFRCMGFATVIQSVELKGDQVMDITLPNQAYRLQEVEVDGNEDPAYRIMRLAAGKRKFYQKQVDEYACRVYIKGLNYIENAPERILGQDITLDGLDSSRSGIVYLSESVSELHFKAPDKTTERVIASKVSGNSQGFTWNNATSLQFNFYDRMYDLEGVSSRNLVSPLSPSATMYYRFKYKGFFVEDSLIINRVQLIPKVSGVPLFKGDLLIQENTWRIHGADLYLTKNSGIEFVDTLKMKVNFIPLNEDVWVKGTMTFDLSFNVKLFKVKGWGSFTSVYSDYDLGSYRPDTESPSIVEVEAEPELENEQTSDEGKPDLESRILQSDPGKLREQFTNSKQGALIKIESEANELSDAFWDSVRVVPLTTMELKDYQKKDSIELIRETPAYQDSIDRVNNRFKAIDLVTGYRYHNSRRNYSIQIAGVLDWLNFNPVEGYNLTLSPEFSISDKKQKQNLTISADARYGFASTRFYLQGKIYRRFNSFNRMHFRVEGGHYVQQFDQGAVRELINTGYALFYETNYMRLYRHSYGELGWGRELFNGFRLRLSAYYGHRNPLRNATGIKGQYIESSKREFEPNDALGEQVALQPNVIGAHVAAITEIAISYRPGLRYMQYPDRKINLGTPYPRFRLNYRKGFAGILGSQTNFDHLQFRMNDDHSLGMAGRFEWSVGAGIFLNKQFVPLANWYHFNTTQTLLAKNGIAAFRGLPYYYASTTEYHVEGHAEQHFRGLILNKIPLIKKLKWHTVAGFHYLYQPDFGHFYEATVGIENIFRVLRVDVAFPFKGKDFLGPAVTVSLPF